MLTFNDIQNSKYASTFCTSIILKKNDAELAFYFPSYLLFILEQSKYDRTIEDEEFRTTNKYCFHLSDYEELIDAKNFFIDYFDFHHTQKPIYLNIFTDYVKLLFSTRFTTIDYDSFYTFFEIYKHTPTSNSIQIFKSYDYGIIDKPYLPIVYDIILSVAINKYKSFTNHDVFNIFNVLRQANHISKLPNYILEKVCLLSEKMQYFNEYFTRKRIAFPIYDVIVLKYFSIGNFKLNSGKIAYDSASNAVFKIELDDNGSYIIHRFYNNELTKYITFAQNEYNFVAIVGGGDELAFFK